MWFRGIELDVGESLHQVSSLSPLNNRVTISSNFYAAWTYRGITKGMSSSRVQVWGSLTLPDAAKARPTIAFIGLVR